MMKSFLQVDKKLKILLHLVAWTILFILPAYFLMGNLAHNFWFSLHIGIQTFGYVLIFYLNYLLLVPKLFFIRKKGLYFLSAIVLIIGVTFMVETANEFIFSVSQKNQLPLKETKRGPENNDPRPPKSLPIYNYMLTSLLISGLSLGLRFSEKLNENEKERKEAEKEKLNSELAFLKNQISPHFFFNTLNNIYSLIEINTVDAQKAVLKLSKLMRYLLYESEQGDSKLSSEIEFMKAYVDLMRLRLNEKVELLVSFPDEFDDVLIPPLLLIPFIENAFKYGISYRDKSFIYLSLQVNNKELVFFCSNSLNNNAGNETHSGIGLENVKKRLNLLFPEKHSISINQKENSFDVLLKIDISTKEKRCEQ